LTIPEIKRLLAALLTRICPPGIGWPGGAAIRPARVGATSACGSLGILPGLPWSASEWRLPDRVAGSACRLDYGWDAGMMVVCDCQAAGCCP